MSTAGHTAASSDALTTTIRDALADSGGWIGFDRFMALALYAPGLGYYARASTQFGAMPQGLVDASGTVQGAGSDFVTAPEMTPLFGYCLAQQVAQAMQATDTFEVWEFGAGTGALALQLLHFSPEASVVARVIESARLLGRDEEVAYYRLRFQAAYPQEYAAWLLRCTTPCLAQPPDAARHSP